MMRYTYTETPVGTLLLAGDSEALRMIEFERNGMPSPIRQGWIEDRTLFADAERQLQEYFAGRLREFELELGPQGTEFQQQVWKRLREIPYGETISYGELARRVGNPNASRAVGAANGRNPVSIVIPCHRVIGSTGKLTGFGGGLDVKKQLLDLERSHRADRLPF